MASLFHSVGKYRKLWITILMVLSMLTFILCAGNKSDITEWIYKNWVPRHGEIVASVNGTNLYRDDIEHLKTQRIAANAYVRSIAGQLIEYISDRRKNMPEKLEEEQQKRFNQILQVQSVLLRRLHETSFFGTGTKLDEVVDFRTWLAEADRLGVSLTDDELKRLIAVDTYRYAVLNAFGNAGEVDRQIQRNAELKVREVSHTASLGVLKKALMDEYRVRIAKLAAIELQVATIDRNSLKGIRPAPYLPSELTRLSLTPAQLYDFYSDNRTEIDVALLAIPVEKFVGQVGDPDAKALDALFAKNKVVPYDPASPDPGFRNQHLIRLKWVTGDPSSPFYKTLARTANDLAAFPIGSFTPQMPLATAVRMAAGQAVFDTRIAMEYNFQNRPLFSALSPNFPFGADNLDPSVALPMANFLAYKDPVAKAAVFGALARPDSVFAAVPLFAAEGLLKHPDLIEQGTRIEVKRRFPKYASIVGEGAASGWLAITQLGIEGIEPTLVPLPIVRDSIAEIIERQQASPWVTANILFLKKKMEETQTAGAQDQMERLLERYGPNYKKMAGWEKQNYRNLGLDVVETKKAFGRYDVDTDPELKPLRDSYEKYYPQINIIEGRDVAQGKPRWTDKDFWKVFFDGSETAGIAAESRKFAARPWPPNLTVANPTQLQMAMMQMDRMALSGMDQGAAEEFNTLAQGREANRASVISLIGHAEKPFLVWKIEEQIGDPPRELGDVKDKVVKAWKMQEAREKKALPYAQKIAEGLLRGNAPYRSVLSFSGKDVDAKLVELSRIAKLAEAAQQPGMPRGGDYGPFQLKGELKYPRDDTVANLIALNGLKEPIKLGIPDLDAVNAALFAEAAKANRGPEMFVQILTNQPRDTFYVAVVDGKRGVSLNIAPMLRDRDTMLDRAQAKRGEEFLQTFIVQLRERFKVKINDVAKNADNEGG